MQLFLFLSSPSPPLTCKRTIQYHSYSNMSMSSSPMSSPVSSPSFGPTDSSPPSSPDLSPVLTTTTPAFGSPSLSHPYAASTKANKRPKLYERHENGGTRSFPRRDTVSSDLKSESAWARADSTESSTSGSSLVHPFAASAKPSWRPPRREAKYRRVDSAASASSGVFGGSDADSMDVDPLHLDDLPKDVDVVHQPADEEPQSDRSKDWVPFTEAEKEHEKKRLERKYWDEALTKAIEDANGIIDLR